MTDTNQDSGMDQPPDAVAGLDEEIENADTCEAWTMGDDLSPECALDPYETPKPTDEKGTCIVCKRRPTSRKCAQCGNDWICCQSCEEYMDLVKDSHTDVATHMIACQSRPQTTADIILGAVCRDELPNDPQAEDDYGFSRCRSLDCYKLLTVYHDLIINLHVTPYELDVWMKENRLYERIGAKIKARPLSINSSARAWFSNHKAVFVRPTYGNDDQRL
ncbi:hypothetical protein CSUB01_10615 [Colletotrichum sublineola]|uniref:Suppressor of anucleate metulae protein B n=1 Tax=Colletotrichum sublineola TaxID=1173701 RepID=A0A066XG44_COLSU|nr:hypothetical protein CSUB01_10615 [Colletotrichum sublineola]